ncbi:MAG: hypothetical protein L0Z53_05005 [Acidobacteriales bacterium]|nr:hypothetical protein [Terriglobales bacterium]
MVLVRIPALALLLILIGAAGALAQNPATDKRELDLPIYRWLNEPDREEIPVKVRVIGPVLTFEQRHQVRVVAVINARALQKKGVERELHYVMKIADETGQWYAEENYGMTKLTSKLTGRAQLELVSDTYLQPGEYTIALIIHDVMHNHRTVLRRRIRVPPIRNDPLPQLDRGLPRAEFLADPVLGVAALGTRGAILPLRSTRPLHIDLIVDFGAYREYLRSRGARFYASRLLQTSQVISRIAPTNGCLEVSAVDILRTEVFFRRKPAGELQWWEVREQILGRNLEVVDADVLASRLKTASLFAKFLEDLLKEPATCGLPGQDLERIVVIVASGVAFPPKTRVEPPPLECDCRIYYLRQVANPYYPFDDMPRLLKHLNVKKINLENPEEFRKELAELLGDLEQLSKNVD